MFRNDYSEIAHPEVIKAITDCLCEQNTGYGIDAHSENAERLIKKEFGVDGGAVFFLSGGTQTNMTVISYLLRPYEGVITCDTGHINVHETAAVEGSGHKIYTFKNHDGKLLPEDIDVAMALNADEHTVKLKLVYVSNATETGTVYSLKELEALRKKCDEHGLYLFVDGARLGVALTAKGSDITPKAMGKLCDIFYIGGTKNGLMYGEAVVFKNKEVAEYFRHHIKNRGAMNAKGFVLGIQFERLFTDGLYYKLAENSNSMAEYIKKELMALGVEFVGNSTTNQLFIRLPKAIAGKITADFGCEVWTQEAETTVIRIVTSFATKQDDCNGLIDAVKSLVKK